MQKSLATSYAQIIAISCRLFLLMHCRSKLINYLTCLSNLLPTGLAPEFRTLYLSTGKKRYPQIKYVVCQANPKRADSRYWCVKCGVGLCLQNCFKIYHTVYNYKREDDPRLADTLNTECNMGLSKFGPVTAKFYIKICQIIK